MELVVIPSPSRCEREVADYIIPKIEALGYKVIEDDAASAIKGSCGNLLIDVPANGTGNKLFISTHIDTVEDGVEEIIPVCDPENEYLIFSQRDSILGADAKIGVAEIMEFLELLAENDIQHGGLKIALTVSEETTLLGAKQIAPEFYMDCDAGIALDHSFPNEAITSAPTKMAIKVYVHGTGGHAAFPEQQINAACVLGDIVSRLPSRRLDDYTTANVGIIQSGTALNVIPEHGTLEYEIRSHKKELLEFHLNRTLSTIDAAVREGWVSASGSSGGIGDDASGEDKLEKATFDVDITTCYEAYDLPADSAPVRILRNSIESCGMEFKGISAQGASDGNIFNAQGLPTAVLGCGMHGVHSIRESADLKEAVKTVEVLLAALQA